MLTFSQTAPSKGSVLVVDDDPDIRRLICEGLTAAGYQVVAARHGREALDHLRASALPDLIVLDLVMPVMDGWEFRRQQVAEPSLATIPVLILTVVEAPLMPTGAAAYLRKPFEFPRLINIVGILCQQRRGAAAALAAEDPLQNIRPSSTVLH
ncbi:MAG: response regulator [Acidobacteria bacterium]|nr:response regulator [Acidobacteriota bacterium]